MGKYWQSSTSTISIHAPREGGDEDRSRYEKRCRISIHAPREGGDPIWKYGRSPTRKYFNPRPPRGGRRRVCRILLHHKDFNPRPPRGGRRAAYALHSTPCIEFQSTPPARGATAASPPCVPYKGNFNPRPPRGGRPTVKESLPPFFEFQSTPPARGATPPYISRFMTI